MAVIFFDGVLDFDVDLAVCFEFFEAGCLDFVVVLAVVFFGAAFVDFLAEACLVLDFLASFADVVVFLATVFFAGVEVVFFFV